MSDKNDLTVEEANKLFNDISKSMKEDDVSTISSLTSVEDPEEEEQGATSEELPDDQETIEEGQPELEEEEEEESPSDDQDDKKTDTPKDKEKELTPVEKQLAELQAQLEAARKDNQALRSQAGRVPSIQRKLTELDKKLAEIRSSTPSSQTSAKVKPKVDKLLEGIRDTDPALADAVAQAVAAAMEGVDEELRTKEESTLSLLREQHAAEYQEEQQNRLLSMYPNAPEVFASPYWAEWKKGQPEHILKLAHSDNADAVAMAFDLYTKDMLEKYPDLKKAQEQVPAKNEEADENTEKARKLEEERQKRKKDSVDLGTARTAGKVKEPTDPQKLFDMYTQKIVKDMKGI